MMGGYLNGRGTSRVILEEGKKEELESGDKEDPKMIPQKRKV